MDTRPHKEDAQTADCDTSKMKPFNADSITADNWSPVLSVRKKPIVVHAVQLNFPEGFTVTTQEGPLRGKPGDYLMIGVDGEKYPIAKEIFEKTYEILDEYGIETEA